MRADDIARLRAELAARFFRGLFDAWDLHEIRGVRVAVPKGTPVFAGGTVSEVAWQISEHASGGDGARPAAGQRPAPDPRPAGSAARGGPERTAGQENWPPEQSQPPPRSTPAAGVTVPAAAQAGV